MNEIYTEQRYVPQIMRGQRVVKVEAIPPQSRTAGDAPIVRELTLIKVHLETGTVHHYGTTHAYIDSHLRMVMAINPRDEVLSKWQKVRTESSKPGLIIEICPSMGNASPYLPDGRSVREDQDMSQVLAECRASGDCQPACEYVRDHVGVEWRIVAPDGKGGYENRLATAEEKAKTCREIYFDSQSDFDDEPTAEMYLIWQAASEAEWEEDQD